MKTATKILEEYAGDYFFESFTSFEIGCITDAMNIYAVQFQEEHAKQILFLQDQIKRYKIQLDEDEHERENLENEQEAGTEL